MIPPTRAVCLGFIAFVLVAASAIISPALASSPRGGESIEVLVHSPISFVSLANTPYDASQSGARGVSNPKDSWQRASVSETPGTDQFGLKKKSCGVRVRVRKGDTLKKIARRCHITVRRLIVLNDLGNQRQIVAGQILQLKVKETVPPLTLSLPSLETVQGVSLRDPRPTRTPLDLRPQYLPTPWP